MGQSFIKAVAFKDLVDRKSACMKLNDWPVLLIYSSNKVFAMMNMCSHQNSELEGGRIRRGTIMCPLHGARFKLENGENIGGQYPPVKTFNSRIKDAWVEVEIPDEAYVAEIASASGF
ncbi:Rieske (2Fe-2S) protein [Litorimonas sp.]|uniref:Rieske (2Fe-2S) protein n=1 Tax=Litorimonas sp. TaxID=1892381 RepID=UPI003A8B85E6